MDCRRGSRGKAAGMWPSLTIDIQWVLDEYERSKDDVVVVTLTSCSVIYGVRRLVQNKSHLQHFRSNAR
jgi:hypothetical protein